MIFKQKMIILQCRPVHPSIRLNLGKQGAILAVLQRKVNSLLPPGVGEEGVRQPEATGGGILIEEHLPNGVLWVEGKAAVVPPVPEVETETEVLLAFTDRGEVGDVEGDGEGDGVA